MTKTERILQRLRDFESRNITFVDPRGGWPIVWERARGTRVWDAAGRRYLDLTGAFGVAAAGHANPRVVRAGQRQMARLLHAMGDVHPHAGKAELARKLSALTFERWTAGERKPGWARGKTVFGNSGFEAVEVALKTALLATGRPGIIAFEGAYHGVGYGALNVTQRGWFRAPFLPQLREFGWFVPFPVSDGALAEAERRIARRLGRGDIGAVLIEPVQGRGGMVVPSPGLLPLVRRLCDAHRVLLIVDEIFTGFGRTGKWFACEHTATVPDVVCLGKALTGGFPLSACVGRADLMDAAWPAATGEAIHTSTFLGHPVGCAMALAQIEEIEGRDLVERSARLGRFLLGRLERLATAAGGGGPGRGWRGAGPAARVRARGLGLMAGLELRQPDGLPGTDLCLRVVRDLLRRGFILLPEGGHGDVISFTPPLTITRADLARTVDQLAEVLAEAFGMRTADGGPRNTEREWQNAKRARRDLD